MTDIKTLEKAARMALKTLEYIDLQDNDRDFLSYKECHDLDEAITALRQALEQPASKPWVGLTEKEKREARNSVSYSPLAMTMSEWTEAVQDAIEAKLKEKNA